MKIKISREFPILSNWTSQDVWARVNFELSSCQGFGKGIEDDRIKVPKTPSLSIQGEEEDISAKKVIPFLYSLLNTFGSYDCVAQVIYMQLH